MSKPIAATFALLITALSAWAAAAQGVCVDCKGPERSYRCTVKDSDRVQGIRGAGRAIELLCISEIARAGTHESCRVNTSYAGPCIGQHHEVDLAKAADSTPVVGRPPDQEGEAPAQGIATPAAPARKGPPQTLEELARDTVSKSKEQLDEADRQVRKAGDAVGDAVKQTWECLTSLFKRC